MLTQGAMVKLKDLKVVPNSKEVTSIFESVDLEFFADADMSTTRGKRKKSSLQSGSASIDGGAADETSMTSNVKKPRLD